MFLYLSQFLNLMIIFIQSLFSDASYTAEISFLRFADTVVEVCSDQQITFLGSGRKLMAELIMGPISLVSTITV